LNLFSTMDLAVCALSAYVGIKNFLYFLRMRAERERLHFSLLCLSIALYDAASALLYASSAPSSGTPWNELQFFFSILIALEVVNFSYCILARKGDWPRKMLIGAFAACFAAGLFLGRDILDPGQSSGKTIRAFGAWATYYERKPGIVWNALLLSQILAMCYLYALLFREFIKRKRKDLLPILIGFLAFFSSIGLDILTASNVLDIPYTSEYAFLILIIAMDDLLQRRFIGALREVEALNRGLGEKVRERTQEIQELVDELTAANVELKEKNSILTELAERDSMTELLNHAAFHRRFSELFNLSKRHAIPICVMIIDIDHFKSVNDRFGHQAGDTVIRAFADTLKAGSRNYDIKSRYHEEGDKAPAALRNYDVAGRYGGDEFAIALPYCGESEAKIVAERILSMIRDLAFAQYPELKVSASIGCAVMTAVSRAADEFRAIKLADRALYAAKERGRNNYVLSSPEDDIEVLE
jgi:GGDEF domain-containing protein